MMARHTFYCRAFEMKIQWESGQLVFGFKYRTSNLLITGELFLKRLRKSDIRKITILSKKEIAPLQAICKLFSLFPQYTQA